jgi:hypothetical protein
MNELQEQFHALLKAYQEWLLIDASGKSFYLKSAEFEIEFAKNKWLFSFLSEKGFQTWCIVDFQIEDVEVLLELTRNFEREKTRIRLVPRVPAKDLRDSLELVGLKKANQLAVSIVENFSTAKLVRVALNREDGRLAQIVFENSEQKLIAVLSDVSESLTSEMLLSAAIFWFVRLGKRRREPIESIWIASAKKQAKSLQKLHALLKPDWKKRICIKELDGDEIKNLPSWEAADLWRCKAPAVKLAENFQNFRIAEKIVEIAPNEIDYIFSEKGETLRFNGLPFARVRKVFDEERVWFGLEKTKRILSEENFEGLLELIENLRKFRSSDSPNKRHIFYQTAPEAWLEAILRKNIKKLDANLVLSPLYHQFRAGRERVDLLALRKDGRLVIIEIKAVIDREMIFQVIDYWHKIELQRRAGNLQKARLFGDAKIADAPTICYLAAPTLSFHREFEFLLNTISDEIEIYRFNLAENWREDLKVLERKSRH